MMPTRIHNMIPTRIHHIYWQCGERYTRRCHIKRPIKRPIKTPITRPIIIIT
jgi:hypothetical protein